MSTDYDIACLECGIYTHLGQRMANKYSFGYGSKDEEGRRRVWAFIDKHISHTLQIYEANCTPETLTPVELGSLEPLGDPA